MKKLILTSVILLLVMGCSGKWDKDGVAFSCFSGMVSGTVDTETGDGSWTRLGEYKASGIEILKEGDDYIISFDSSESKTEFDKMKFFFEKGIEMGKAL